MTEHINTLGLVFDVLGVVLLWKFGLPEDVSRSGSIGYSVCDPIESEKKKAKLYDCLSHWALFFIVLGFVLQICSNYWQQITDYISMHQIL